MSATSALRALTKIAPAQLAVAALAAGVATVALPAAHAVAADGAHTYYVSPAGSDSNSGTDAAHPFKSLAKVSNGFLQAGDSVLLQGGATFTDKLAVWSNGTAAAPITISKYGNGKATLSGQCLDLGGDYLTVSKVRVTDCDDDSGIWVYGANDVVSKVEVTHNIQGIVVDTHAQGAKILNNKLHNNDRMAPNTPGAFDDYGAIGVVVDGDNTEVAFNKMSNNVAASADFGQDGSAVEIYGGIGTNVHDNVSTNNFVFTELGNKRSANTTFTNNKVSSSLANGAFLTTRGSSDYFGPVAGTVATDNTVQLTGANSTGYICYAGCTANVLDLSNNVLDVNGRIGYLEGTLSGGNNTYWNGTMTGLPMLPGDQVANPGLVNVTDRTHQGHKGGKSHSAKHAKHAKGHRNS